MPQGDDSGIRIINVPRGKRTMTLLVCLFLPKQQQQQQAVYIRYCKAVSLRTIGFGTPPLIVTFMFTSLSPSNDLRYTACGLTINRGLTGEQKNEI